MTTAATPETVSLKIKNPQEAIVVNWFLQNKKVLENMLGTPVSEMSLTFSDVEGVELKYTPAAATGTAQTTGTPPTA